MFVLGGILIVLALPLFVSVWLRGSAAPQHLVRLAWLIGGCGLALIVLELLF